MRKSYGRARDVEVPVTTSRQKSRLALARTNITRAHMYYVYREEEYNDGGGGDDVGAAGCFDSAIFSHRSRHPLPLSRFALFLFLSPWGFFFFLFIHPARPAECVSILTRKSATMTTATTTRTTTMCTRNPNVTNTPVQSPGRG